MRRPSNKILSMAIWVLILGAQAPLVRAQSTEQSGADVESAPHQALRATRNSPERNIYRESTICSGCHKNKGDFPADVLNRLCLTEFATWKTFDRHSQAFTNLLESERGRRIGERLKKDVHQLDTGCVQCHSLAGELPDYRHDNPSQLVREGVSCEACHGPSTEWFDEHSDYRKYPSWQAKDLEEKTRMGWVDLRSAVTRAEVCNSCHLGSDSHGRRITHEMYAAGHPPLSGFEIESFADKLPRHWQYSNELAQPEAEDKAVAEPAFVRTRNLLISSVVSLRMAVELAMADAKAPVEMGRWPELARLDCFACHHELVEPGWRQIRQVSTTLGRPQIALGCIPLVMVATDLAKPQSLEDFNTIMTRLREPFSENVFGDREQLTEQGEYVVAWCRSLESRLEEMDFGSKNGAVAASAVLRAIPARGKNDLYDFDTARQLLGAWLVVYDELNRNKATRLSKADQTRLEAMLAQIGRNDPFVLERDRIKLPCAQPTEGQKPDTESQREADLSTLFDKRTQYKPVNFAKAMATLSELVDE